MENSLSFLDRANHTLQSVGSMHFHSQRRSSFSSQIATQNDIQWIEEQKYMPYFYHSYMIFIESRKGPFKLSWKKWINLLVDTL